MSGSGAGDKVKKNVLSGRGRGARGGHSLGRRDGSTNLLQPGNEAEAQQAASMVTLPNPPPLQEASTDRPMSAPARTRFTEPPRYRLRHHKSFDDVCDPTREPQQVVPPRPLTAASRSTGVMLDLPSPTLRPRRNTRPMTADSSALPKSSAEKRKK